MITIKQLIDLMNKAIEKGELDPEGEILASVVFGDPKCDKSLLETALEINEDEFYMMVTIPGDEKNVGIFYTTASKEEENQ